MPKMDGGELARRLISKNENMKVVFMSGFMDEEVLRKGVESNNYNFLHKPINQEKLTHKIREVLDSKITM